MKTLGSYLLLFAAIASAVAFGTGLPAKGRTVTSLLILGGLGVLIFGAAAYLTRVKWLGIKRRTAAVEVFASIMMFWFFAVVLTPILLSARASATQTGCHLNLKLLAQAANLYADDHDGHYPVNDWEASIRPYLGQAIRVCPSARSAHSYALNRHLMGFTVKDVAVPAETVLFLEVESVSPSPVGVAGDVVIRHSPWAVAVDGTILRRPIAEVRFLP